MRARIARRADRARTQPADRVPRSGRHDRRGRAFAVRTRATGRFDGSEIPADLQRQWIQGTGPAARPHVPTETSIRNVAYALLSGADGWMFDGEDALGQISTMSLDNQRNLKLAIHRDPVFLEGRRAGGRRDERVGARLLRTAAIDHRLEAAARLHDEDLPRARAASRRPPRPARRRRRLFGVDRRCGALRRQQPPAAAQRAVLARAVPAEDPDRRGSGALERHPVGARAAPRPAGRHDQGLRARRAGRGVLPVDGDPRRARPHFVGFNTGRWDYINSVSDAMAWDARSSTRTSTPSR